MVTVWVLRNAQKEPVGFRAKGHAGWGEYGKDIACAGISALLLTTVLGLLEVVKLKVDYYQTKEGELFCRLPGSCPSKKRQEASILMNTLLCGLRAIQKEYPGSIRMYNVKADIKKNKGGKKNGRS